MCSASMCLLPILFALLSSTAQAQPPETFDAAKRLARDVVYANHKETIYCGCRFEDQGASGGVIDADSCGIKARKNESRALRLEWEHATPAAWFGRLQSCWTQGDPACIGSNGKAFKGRKCCQKVSPEFRRAEADLHNLFPAAGELNGDRGDKPYGLIEGEPREYGECDFEVSKGVAEPREAVRGELARAILYMDATYGPFLTEDQQQLYQGWSDEHPPAQWEQDRKALIEAINAK